MQDRAFEIIGKKQIAASSDMKNGTGQLIEFYIHKISHRIIFNETARLNLHSKGIQPCQVFMVFRLYHS